MKQPWSLGLSLLALSLAPAGAHSDGPRLAADPSWQIQTDYIGSRSAAAGVGDVNGDGYDDVMVGANGAYFIAGGSEPGKALAFYGSATGLPLTPSWVGEGPPQTLFGGYVAPAGDVNNDGYDDVIVGAPGFIPPPDPRIPPLHLPRAHLFLGSASGLSGPSGWQAVQSRFPGNTTGAGDVNGDGFDDVIQGDPGHIEGGSRVGRAVVFYGSAASLPAVAGWTVFGDQNGAEFAQHVAGAGDVNGDGYDDVIVSVPGYDTTVVDAGRVIVYLGSAVGLSTVPAWVTEGTSAAAVHGDSVASAGDLDRDGYDDVIVSAPGSAGRVRVYYGSAAGLSTTAAWTLSGLAIPFGSEVASAGDLNGDGYRDVAVAAPRCQSDTVPSGHAYVFEGSPAGLPTLPSWTSDTTDTELCFPLSVAGAGDVNGDGLSDLVLSGMKGPYFDQVGAMAEAYYGARPSGKFYAVAPCRVVDTRNPGEGPALGANTLRAFPVRGVCGVPADALAVAANVTAVSPTDLGNLRVFPSGTATPLASTLNFAIGQTRANHTIVRLGSDGQLGVRCDMAPGSTGEVHLVVDVSGYFRP
jgi:hypothetical protein